MFDLYKALLIFREKQSSSSNHRDRESLQTNVRQLVYVTKAKINIFYAWSSSEVNKQLRDENDSLRAMIESRKLLLSTPEVNRTGRPDEHVRSMSIRCYHRRNG